MTTPDYPSNSQYKRVAQAPEPKNVEKVIVGTVEVRKPGIGKRLREIFIGGDAQSVWGYIAYDILIPAVKDTMVDAVSMGVERMFFGEVRGTTRGRFSSGPLGSTNYSSFSKPGGSRYSKDDRQISRRARASHDFNEIALETRAEASLVLERMDDLIERYGQALVSDLYDLVGITGDFTDEKYGWDDLRGARIVRRNYGYVLDLPRPEVMER